jgi:hypothetical protein
MSAINENAFQERLRTLREPAKAPSLPSVRETWETMKKVWVENGRAWEIQKTEKAVEKESQR